MNISPFELNPFEQRIMDTLENAYRPLTTKQVAEFANISYNAAKFNLGLLLKRGKVKKKELSKNKILWSAKDE